MSLSTYLGNPSGPFGMQAVPTPEPGGAIGLGGVSTTVSRGTVTTTLVSGGTATMRRPMVKRDYSVLWSILLPTEVDLLMSFFDGRQGGGPYCLMDPSWGNQLPANVASLGAVLGALPEWSPTAGSLASNTAAPPTGFLSGVGAWSGASSGSILYMGLNNIIDGTLLPPTIPGLSHRFDIWAKLASGTASLAPTFLAGTGGAAGTSLSSSSAIVLNTGTWQQLTIRVPSSTSWTASEDYVALKLTVSSASSPVILLSGASFVYDTAANANPLPTWVSGLGVPRCLITGDAPTPVDLVGWRDWTMTLQEA